MTRQRYMDFCVGIFMLAGVLAFLLLVLKVSGIGGLFQSPGYEVIANFTDIGGLRVHAPVTVAGVKIGEVSKIELQPEALEAKVTLRLQRQRLIPAADAEARILTEGILGSNYISIIPGFEEEGKVVYLGQGDIIARTHEAIILENLIGQLLFNANNKQE